MYRYLKWVLLAAAIIASGAAAYAARVAGEGEVNDALAIASAGIPLTQAVTVAERHVNGKAARAEYESSAWGKFYEVEVTSGNRVFDVKVDADKGGIISSVEDKADHDDDHDSDHDGQH